MRSLHMRELFGHARYDILFCLNVCLKIRQIRSKKIKARRIRGPERMFLIREDRRIRAAQRFAAYHLVDF